MDLEGVAGAGERINTRYAVCWQIRRRRSNLKLSRAFKFCRIRSMFYYVTGCSVATDVAIVSSSCLCGCGGNVTMIVYMLSRNSCCLWINLSTTQITVSQNRDLAVLTAGRCAGPRPATGWWLLPA